MEQSPSWMLRDGRCVVCRGTGLLSRPDGWVAVKGWRLYVTGPSGDGREGGAVNRPHVRGGRRPRPDRPHRRVRLPLPRASGFHHSPSLANRNIRFWYFFLNLLFCEDFVHPQCPLSSLPCHRRDARNPYGFSSIICSLFSPSAHQGFAAGPRLEPPPLRPRPSDSPPLPHHRSAHLVPCVDLVSRMLRMVADRLGCPPLGHSGVYRVNCAWYSQVHPGPGPGINGPTASLLSPCLVPPPPSGVTYGGTARWLGLVG